MRKKIKSSKQREFDSIAENTISKLSAIKDQFDLDSNEYLYELTEIVLYVRTSILLVMELFTTKFIPYANRLDAEVNQLLRNSNIKVVERIEANNNSPMKYETLAWAYVVLFHKYEVFIKRTVSWCNSTFSTISGEQIDVDVYINKICEFTFGVSKNYQFEPELKRINFISNSVKHHNGFPKNNSFQDLNLELDAEGKVLLTIDQLKKDIKYILDLTDRMIGMVPKISISYFQQGTSELVSNKSSSDKLEILEQLNISILKEFFTAPPRIFPRSTP
jgi:hypothetical protein